MYSLASIRIELSACVQLRPAAYISLGTAKTSAKAKEEELVRFRTLGPQVLARFCQKSLVSDTGRRLEFH